MAGNIEFIIFVASFYLQKPPTHKLTIRTQPDNKEIAIFVRSFYKLSQINEGHFEKEVKKNIRTCRQRD